MSSGNGKANTPTEELILDVLVARWRLGEGLWTFDSRLALQVRRLEARGLVIFMGGATEGTVRASLTQQALAGLIHPATTGRLEGRRIENGQLSR